MYNKSILPQKHLPVVTEIMMMMIFNRMMITTTMVAVMWRNKTCLFVTNPQSSKPHVIIVFVHSRQPLQTQTCLLFNQFWGDSWQHLMTLTTKIKFFNTHVRNAVVVQQLNNSVTPHFHAIIMVEWDKHTNKQWIQWIGLNNDISFMRVVTSQLITMSSDTCWMTSQRYE